MKVTDLSAFHVIRRDGHRVDFDPSKIRNAIANAFLKDARVHTIRIVVASPKEIFIRIGGSEVTRNGEVFEGEEAARFNVDVAA